MTDCIYMPCKLKMFAIWFFKEKLTDLGAFYATLRISRGYTQDQVATKGLSKSQISNFENGKHMLSASSLLLAIRGIHMSANEFFYA